MATTVKNVGRIPVQVGIILANGKKTSIRVMQRSPKPVGLPVGARIDENWLALNGKNILVKTTEVAKSTPVSAPAAGPVEAPVATAIQSGTGEPVVIKSPEPAVAKAPAEKAVASTTTNDTSKE